MRHCAAAMLALIGCGSGQDITTSTDAGGDASTTNKDGGSTVVDAARDVVDESPPHGSIDPKGGGGTVNRLAFTAFGDMRPPLPDEDFAYPDSTVQAVMTGMASNNPEFAVATGDYMFVEYVSLAASGQLNHLLADEKNFTPPIFHAMGNHECQSFTDVNCPNLNESVNITAYMQTLIPWTNVPWFSFMVHTDFGDAKFVFIAVNAWNTTQQTWLTQTMAIPTKYTFVIRHHPTPDGGKASSAEGIAGSDAILNNYAVTLFLFGHVHEYQQIGANRVITGNAGAPLDSGEFGWLYVEQRPDGNVQATEYTLNSTTTVDFAVTPDGQATK